MYVIEFLTQIPADKFKFWFDILTVLTAFFSALTAVVSIRIAFFSLREARRQRESSYKPDLFLSFQTMSSRITNFQTGVREVQCVVYNNDLKEFETWGILHGIENIGLGAAKNVKIKWSFDCNEARKVIAKTVKTPTQLRITENGDLELLDKNGMELIFSSYHDINDPIKYDFILPRKDEKFDKSPSIPQEILELHSIMFLAKHHVFNLTEMSGLYFEHFEEFPPLIAEITYSDIGGKNYSKKFLCSINMRLVEHTPNVIKLKKIKHLDIDMFVESEVII